MMSRFVALVAVIVAVSLGCASSVPALEFLPSVSLSVSEDYNDNIFLTRNNKEGDFITYITPAVNLALRLPYFDFRVDYAPTFSLYSSNSDQNYTAENLTFSILPNIATQTNPTVHVAGNYTKSADVRTLTTLVNAGPITTSTPISVLTLYGDIAYRATGNLTITPSFSYSSSKPDDPALSETTSYTGGLTIGYVISERTTLSLVATYSKYDYTVGSDSTNQSYTAGISYRLTPTLTMGLTGGVTITEQQNGDGTDTGFTGGANLTKTFERGTLNVSYWQDVIPSIDVGEPVMSQSFTVAFSRPLAERISGSVGGSFNKYKSVSGSATNTEQIIFNAGLGYALTSWLNLGLSYNFVDNNDKVLESGKYTNNIVSLFLRASYGRTLPVDTGLWPASVPTPRAM